MLAAALATARRAHAAATGRWRGDGDDASGDEADAAHEAEAHAKAALVHLDAGRWDDAEACAGLCVELEEEWGQTVWREWALLVEEVAALGREG